MELLELKRKVEALTALVQQEREAHKPFKFASAEMLKQLCTALHDAYERASSLQPRDWVAIGAVILTIYASWAAMSGLAAAKTPEHPLWETLRQAHY